MHTLRPHTPTPPTPLVLFFSCQRLAAVHKSQCVGSVVSSLSRCGGIKKHDFWMNTVQMTGKKQANTGVEDESSQTESPLSLVQLQSQMQDLQRKLEQVCLCVCVCVHLCMYHACVHAYVCVHACMGACMWVCVCVCVRVCAHNT